MARNDQGYVEEVKLLVRKNYDHDEPPKADANTVREAVDGRDLGKEYSLLQRRGEIYEFGEFVRVTEDAI